MTEEDDWKKKIEEQRKIELVCRQIDDIVMNDEGSYKASDWIDVWKKVGEDFVFTYMAALNGCNVVCDYDKLIYKNAKRFMETIITREEYRARRNELQNLIFDCRQKERQEIQQVEDDKHLAHRNAADKIKAFTERVEKEKIENLRHLNRVEDDIHRKYAGKRANLDAEIKLLDAELKHAYYVNLKEGNENDNPNF